MDETEQKVSETVLTIMSHLRSVLSKCRDQNENPVHMDQNLKEKCNNTKLQETTRTQLRSEPRPMTRTSLKTALSEREKLGKLIADATAENFQLRDSNVQLRRLSKLQDCKTRELKYKISLQGQRIVKERAARKSILELENALKGKMMEIQKLRHEIQEVKQQLPDESPAGTAFRPSKSPATRPRFPDEKLIADGAFKPQKTPSRRLSDDKSLARDPFSSPKTPTSRMRLFDNKPTSKKGVKEPITPARGSLFPDNKSMSETSRCQKSPSRREQLFGNKPQEKFLFGNKSSSETTIKPPKASTSRLQFADNKSISETSFNLPKTPVQGSKSVFSKKLPKRKKESNYNLIFTKLNGILEELNSCRSADIGGFGPSRKILEDIQDRVLHLLGRVGIRARSQKSTLINSQRSPHFSNRARDKGDGRTVKVEIFECMDKAVQVSLGDWCYQTK